MLIRQGSEDDLAAVTRLSRRCFADPWSEGGFLSALESGYELILAESDEGEVIGYILAVEVVGEVQIMLIAVSPDHRRQGIAAQLSEALFARYPDLESATLEVRVGNKPARALYARLGFTEVGQRPNYYAPDANGIREDAVLMTREFLPNEKGF